MVLGIMMVQAAEMIVLLIAAQSDSTSSDAVPVFGKYGSTVYWQAGTGSVSTDPATGAYDALNRLTTTKWDTGLGMTTSNFYPNSNLPSGYAATLPGAGGTRFGVYSSQGMTWQGSLLTGYTVTSNWEGGGTSYAADYDTDGHLHDWSAAAMGSIGTATQQFNERYGFSLENMQSIVGPTTWD